MSDWTKEPWCQGRTLLTARTKRWRQDVWDENEAQERRRVFAYFSASDEGRGRELVAECQTENEAARICSCVNALEGFPDPEADVQALVEALHSLAMMGLQSPRYSLDRDFRDAVDNSLSMVARLRREP